METVPFDLKWRFPSQSGLKWTTAGIYFGVQARLGAPGKVAEENGTKGSPALGLHTIVRRHVEQAQARIVGLREVL